MIDYHVHTQLCNHARGPMEAYIRQAITMGLKEMCFLDHLTMHDYGKRLSMTPKEVPLYFQAVQQLKHKYRGKIKVKAGLELDFVPEYTDFFQTIVDTYSFDMIGSSLHFLGDMDIVTSKSDWKKGNLDIDYVYGLYFSQLDKMLDYNYFDVICHIDLIKKFGWKPSASFDKVFHKILLKIKKKNLAVEINTSGYEYPVNEVFPSPAIIRECYKLGINITIGSDSHKPESIGQHYDKVLPLLISAGYRQLTTFTKRKQKMVPLKT